MAQMFIPSLDLRACLDDGREAFLSERVAYWVVWNRHTHQPVDARQFPSFAEALAALRLLRQPSRPEEPA